jgi:hypothetical protein
MAASAWFAYIAVKQASGPGSCLQDWLHASQKQMQLLLLTLGNPGCTSAVHCSPKRAEPHRCTLHKAMEAQHCQLSIAVLIFCAGHTVAVAPGDTCVMSPAGTACCLNSLGGI